MLVRLVACKTHASVHGVFSSGPAYEVSDEKGAALLELVSESGDQFFVEVDGPAPATEAVAEDDAAPVEATKPTTTKVKLGGNKNKSAESGESDSGTVTV